MNKRGIDMKKVQWEMKERFVFPVATGMPTGAESMNVTPMFTISRTDDAVRLAGIYHIAANIMVNEKKTRAEIMDSAILIDDVEVEGETGYFEYAVPFNIDLPPEANDPLSVTTGNASCKIDGQGTFAVTWEVECSYLERSGLTEEERVANEQAVLEDKVVTKEIVLVKEEQAERQVAEAVVVEEKKAEQQVAEVVVEEKKAERQVAEAVVVREEKVERQEAEVVAKAIEVEAPTAVVLLESTSFNDMDEVLSFIEGIEDGISLSLFRSNDVFVQGKT